MGKGDAFEVEEINVGFWRPEEHAAFLGQLLMQLESNSEDWSV